MIRIPVIIVVLMPLLGILATACSSDAQTEQITREDVQTDQSTKKTQIEQPTKLETLTVDDVKGIVVETAMKLHQDGLMPEPREIHAEEACKLWDEHGTSKSSSCYWGHKMSEAEDANLRDALPVLVIVRTLVTLNERYETSEPAIAQYCDNLLRAESRITIDPSIDLSHLPHPVVENVYSQGGSSCPPGARQNVLRALECRVSYPQLIATVVVKGDASRAADYLSEHNYDDETIATACSPELIAQRFDGWDSEVLEHWRDNNTEDPASKLHIMSGLIWWMPVIKDT